MLSRKENDLGIKLLKDMQIRLLKGIKACISCRRTAFFDPFICGMIQTNSLDNVSLASLIKEGFKKFLLADRAIIVLVHGVESFLELLLVKVSIGLNPLKHLSAKLAHFALLQRPIAVCVDACKQFFSDFSELRFCYLRHFTLFGFKSFFLMFIQFH